MTNRNSEIVVIYALFFFFVVGCLKPDYLCRSYLDNLFSFKRIEDPFLCLPLIINVSCRRLRTMKFAEFINLWFACLAVDGAPGSLLNFDCKVSTVMMMMGTTCGGDQQKNCTLIYFGARRLYHDTFWQELMKRRE